jgi:hypothetical protein
MYAAWCLHQPFSCFIFDTIKTWLSLPLLFGVMYGVRKLIPVSSWITLLIDIIICAVLGYAIMAAIYGRNEIRTMLSKIKGRLTK